MIQLHIKMASVFVVGLMSLPLFANSPNEAPAPSLGSEADNGGLDKGSGIASRLADFARIQREYKKVLLSDTLRDALNNHYPSQVERLSEERMTVSSGACRIELELKVTKAEWTDARRETHPRVIEPVVSFRSDECIKGIASQIEGYEHSAWMRLITAATYLSFPDAGPDDYIKKLRYVGPDTLELTNCDETKAEASLSNDVSPFLEEMDED